VALSLGLNGQVLPSSSTSPALPPTPGRLADTLTSGRLSSREKFNFRVIEQFGVRGILGTAVSAAIGQGFDTPDAWGTHWDGYGKRYASGFAVGVTRGVIELGLEDVLHQDPRYFPSSRVGFAPRLRNVFEQVIIAKDDNGRAVIASGRIGGALGAGFIANAWQPKGNGGAADGVERAGLSLVGDAAFFLLQEFVPFIRNSAFRHHR
jgi:hypothetical protein